MRIEGPCARPGSMPREKPQRVCEDRTRHATMMHLSDSESVSAPIASLSFYLRLSGGCDFNDQPMENHPVIETGGDQ